MAATDRSVADLPDANSLAATIRDAEFVRLLVGGTGEALAAAGLLAGGCDAVGTPFHARPVRTHADVTEATASMKDGVCLRIWPNGSVDHESRPHPVSVTAYDAARDLDGTPDPILALAGIIAGEGRPRTSPELLDHASIERGPGVAIPTSDLADGLAHSTLVHAEFSGDRTAAASVIEGFEPTNGREAASALALACIDHAEASERASTVLERVVRPYFGGPFETLGGYADILDTLAHTAPGVGFALALGHDVHDRALAMWREHAKSVHSAVRTAQTTTTDGILIARIDGPVVPTARLLRDYCTTAPVVLAVATDEASAATTTERLDSALARAAAAADGAALTHGNRGYARIDAPDAFIETFLEEQ